MVDPDEELIPDVKVKLSKYKNSMNNAFNRESKIISTGELNFSSDGCYSWILEFEKSRYYSESIGFTLSALADMLDSGEAVLEGNTIVKKVPLHQNLWVTQRRIELK